VPFGSGKKKVTWWFCVFVGYLEEGHGTQPNHDRQAGVCGGDELQREPPPPPRRVEPHDQERPAVPRRHLRVSDLYQGGAQPIRASTRTQ
jgi:hypothetical protein